MNSPRQMAPTCSQIAHREDGEPTDERLRELMDAFRAGPVSLHDIAVKLASTPCGPISMKHPADGALEILAGGALL